MTKETEQGLTTGQAFRQAAGGTAPMPQLFGKQPLNSQNQIPSLFTPPPVNNVIPEAEYNSQTGGFALKSLNPKVAETANRPSLDGLTSQDGAEKQTRLNMAIKGSLERDDGIPVENKLNAARTALQIGVQPSTTGQLYKEKVFPNVPESRINESMDKKIVQDDAKANILTNMGHDPLKKTFDDVMNAESKDFFDIIQGAWSSVLPDAIVNNPVMKLKEGVDDLGKQAFEDVANYITQKTTGNKNSSFKDVVKYLSYIPQNPEAEIEHQRLVKTVFGKTQMGDKVQAMVNWDKEYRAKYGDAGYYQLAAFMAKETLVDGVALSLALRSPKMAKALLPESIGGQAVSGIMTRLVKALGRASVQGLAGTGVQQSMDSYLGFPTSTTNELGARIAGAFVGEGVARVLMATGKGIIGAGYRAIEAGAKLVGKNGEPVATVGENVLEEAMDGLTPTIKDLIKEMPQETTINSPEFKQWFSNSKVVDNTGKPLTVYHGTDKNFTNFEGQDSKVRQPFGDAFFFSDKPAMTPSLVSSKQGGNIRPSYVSLQNPRKVSAAVLGDPRAEAVAIKEAKLQGHDGLIGTTQSGEQFVVAFSDKQIKSKFEVLDTGIPSVGDELSETIGTISTTVPVRDIGSQLKTAMQSDKAGSLGHIFDMSDSEITAATMARQPSLKEQVLLNGVGNRIIGEKVARQTDVDKTLEYYFNHGTQTVAMRKGEFLGDTSLFRAKDWVLDPRNTIGDVADNLYDVSNAVRTRETALLAAQKVAFKGLKTPVRNEVLSVRVKHSEMAEKDTNFVVTQATLEADGLTPDQQDAYYAVGKLLDFSALLTEQSALQSATQKGLKQLHGRRTVQVVKHLDGEDQGAVMVKDIQGGEPFAVHNSELSDVTTIMGYRKYHVPRRADQANYLAGTLDSVTGKLEISTASQYHGEIADHVTKMDTELKGSGKVAFYYRTNTGEGSSNFGVGSSSASALDVLDDAGIAAMKEALKKGGRPDITDEELAGIRLGFDNVTFGSITSQKVAGKRGLEGLKTVTGEAFAYKPDSDAITQHLMEVAAVQGKDFRLNTISKFKKEFKDVLPDPNGDWDQPIVNVLGKSQMAERAKSVQDFIRKSIFNETSYGKSYRNSIDAFAEGLRAKGGTSKAMVDGIEKMPVLGAFFKQTRDGTVFMRKADSLIVFAGNLGSFITQLAPSVAMIVGAKAITNPTHLAKGWGNLLGALAIKAGGGKAMPKEAHAALRSLRQSGLISDVSLDDMAYKAYGQSSTLYSKAMFFVQKGEEMNKANIWMVIREEMKDLANKGNLKGITRDLTAADIDSPEFIQMVSTKAKQLHLDMSPSGRLGLTSGAGATLFQWSSPVIKTHTMFFAKDLSGTEKFGAALGLFSFYGLSAIPFLGTGLFLMDKAGSAFTGNEEIDEATMATDMTNNIAKHLVDEVGDLAGFTAEQKKFYTDTVKKGLVSTLSGNDIVLYQKMSMALFSKSVMANNVQDPLDSIPVISVMRKAAESSANIYEMLDNLYAVYTMTPEEAAKEGTQVSSAMQKKIELRRFMGEVLDEVGNVVPGIGRIADVLNNNPETRRYLNPNTENLPSTGFITRSGKRIETGENVDTRQQMLLLFGIVPAPVQANRDVLKSQYDRVAILTKMKDSWTSRYKNANTDMAKTRVMREAFQASSEAEQVLMATYQGALSIATGSSDDKPYKAGTLRKQWFNAFRKVDEEAISGNRTTSRGE